MLHCSNKYTALVPTPVKLLRSLNLIVLYKQYSELTNGWGVGGDGRYGLGATRRGHSDTPAPRCRAIS
jgi:hypothetical protein